MVTFKEIKTLMQVELFTLESEIHKSVSRIEYSNHHWNTDASILSGPILWTKRDINFGLVFYFCFSTVWLNFSATLGVTSICKLKQAEQIVRTYVWAYDITETFQHILTFTWFLAEELQYFSIIQNTCFQVFSNDTTNYV